MTSDTDAVACGRCGQSTTFLTFIHPLGDTPGAGIYECTHCRYQTWEEWRYEAPSPQPAPEQPVQLQQQQPQSVAKKEQP